MTAGDKSPWNLNVRRAESNGFCGTHLPCRKNRHILTQPANNPSFVDC